MDDLQFIILERIGSHIYNDFRKGRIDFDTLDGSLALLSDLIDGQVVFGAPWPDSNS